MGIRYASIQATDVYANKQSGWYVPTVHWTCGHYGFTPDWRDPPKLCPTCGAELSHVNTRPPEENVREFVIEPKPKITFDYVNHRGVAGKRNATVEKIFFGTSKYYHRPQWLMKVFDHDRNAIRDFSMEKMENVEFV